MDCFFENSEGAFRLRAAAIILEEGCVLMAKNDQEPFFYSVGGCIGLHESAEAAVCREVLEETGTTYKIERLAFVHENFYHGQLNGKTQSCHEVTFYFLMKPKGKKGKINHESFGLQKVREHVHWLPLHRLNEYHLHPAFFKDKLFSVAEITAVEHIITPA